MNAQLEKPPSKKSRDEGLYKTAVLVAGLKRDGADAVLAALGAEQAQRVRRVMADLGEIDPREQRRIIDEFFRAAPKLPKKSPPQTEAASDPASQTSIPRPFHPPRIQSPQTPTTPTSTSTAPTPTAPTPTVSPDTRPFQSLHDTEADRLAGVLAGERPQTIAVVLSHLPADRAGNILVRLHGQLQAEVVHRLVDLEETDTEILRELEQALQSRLSQQVHMQPRRVVGMEAVAGILRASGGRLGIRILDNLATYDPLLAEKLSPGTIEFDDLMRLDDAGLRAVFQAAGVELMMTALIGAPPELIDRVLRRLPARQAQTVRHQLDHPGPIRLSDVDAARREIAHGARHLALEKHIQSPDYLTAHAA